MRKIPSLYQNIQNQMAAKEHKPMDGAFEDSKAIINQIAQIHFHFVEEARKWIEPKVNNSRDDTKAHPAEKASDVNWLEPSKTVATLKLERQLESHFEIIQPHQQAEQGHLAVITERPRAELLRPVQLRYGYLSVKSLTIIVIVVVGGGIVFYQVRNKHLGQWHIVINDIIAVWMNYLLLSNTTHPLFLLLNFCATFKLFIFALYLSSCSFLLTADCSDFINIGI